MSYITRSGSVDKCLALRVSRNEFGSDLGAKLRILFWGAKLDIPLGSIAWNPNRQQGIQLSITLVRSECNESGSVKRWECRGMSLVLIWEPS